MAAPFACPSCRSPLERTSPNEVTCPQDGLRFPQVDGIWRFLSPDRADFYAAFIRDYETIRRAEGRGSVQADYYRALPYQDLSGKMSVDWRIRAASFDALLKRIIAPAGRPLRVLDLGAGNGWLSNRLAGLGHTVGAVDLLTNDFDGLGCRRHYETEFTAVQAEFDRLPCPDRSQDLVVFNAALHYSVDIRRTLSEALRVLDAGARLVVLDSPVYRDARSGERMVREREEEFRKRHGFPSNALASRNFLTYRELDELARVLSVRWRIITPFYGLRWALRPWKARLAGGREPARFHLLAAEEVRTSAA